MFDLTCFVTVVITPRPLAVQIVDLQKFLEGKDLQYQGLEDDLEEGEILSERQIRHFTEELGLNPSNVIYGAPVPESPPEEVDEVEIEETKGEEYPSYRSPKNENIPDFQDLFQEATENELNREIPAEIPRAANTDAESSSAAESSARGRENILKHPEWFKAAPNYAKFYQLHKNSSAGKIISWAYFNDLSVFAVKRERGMQYFGRAHDLQTLPYFDVHQLARLKCLYSDTNSSVAFFERKLKFEFRHGWKMIKLRFPKILDHPWKKHSVTGQPMKINKYKRPEYKRFIPLRQMRQNFTEKFRFWFYDYTTTEAVIVFGEDDEDDAWEDVRVYDPMWLRNLSKRDVEVLYHNPILFAEEDKYQATLFQAVIRVCYEHGGHT